MSVTASNPLRRVYLTRTSFNMSFSVRIAIRKTLNNRQETETEHVNLTNSLCLLLSK